MILGRLLRLFSARPAHASSPGVEHGSGVASAGLRAGRAPFRAARDRDVVREVRPDGAPADVPWLQFLRPRNPLARPALAQHGASASGQRDNARWLSWPSAFFDRAPQALAVLAIAIGAYDCGHYRGRSDAESSFATSKAIP